MESDFFLDYSDSSPKPCPPRQKATRPSPRSALMACLPNVGSLDWALSARDFVRPRRTQDAANLYSLQLANAQQQQRSQHAFQAQDVPKEAHQSFNSTLVQVLNQSTTTYPAMQSAVQQFLDNNTLPRMPSMEPSLSPFVAMAQPEHILQSCPTQVEHRKWPAPRSPGSPNCKRRAPKRVASRNFEHQLPAKRGAIEPRFVSVPARRSFDGRTSSHLAASSATAIDTEDTFLYNYWVQNQPASSLVAALETSQFLPLQGTTQARASCAAHPLPHAQQQQQQPQQVLQHLAPRTQQELQASSSGGAVPAHWGAAQATTTQQQVTPGSHSRSPLDLLGGATQAQMHAIHDMRLSSSGNATESSMAPPVATAQPHHAFDLATTASRAAAATVAPQPQQVTTGGAIEADTSAAAVLAQLQQASALNSSSLRNVQAANVHTSAHTTVRSTQDMLLEAACNQPGIVHNLQLQSLMEAAKCTATTAAQPNMPQVRPAVPCMTSPAMDVAMHANASANAHGQPSALFTPVAMTALNSASSAYTVIDATGGSAPNSSSFRGLNHSHQQHHQHLQQTQQQYHQSVVSSGVPAAPCSNPLRDDPATADLCAPEDPTATEPMHGGAPVATPESAETQIVFDQIQRHDSLMCMALKPLKTLSADNSAANTLAAQDPVAAIEASCDGNMHLPAMHLLHPASEPLTHAAPVPPLDTQGVVVPQLEAAGGSLEVLEATAAALGMLGYLPSVEDHLQANLHLNGLLEASRPAAAPLAMEAQFMHATSGVEGVLGIPQQRQYVQLPQQQQVLGVNHFQVQVDRTTGRDVICVSP